MSKWMPQQESASELANTAPKAMARFGQCEFNQNDRLDAVINGQHRGISWHGPLQLSVSISSER